MESTHHRDLPTARRILGARLIRMALVGLGASLTTGEPLGAQLSEPAPLAVTSPAFENDGPIPLVHSAYGDNISPAIEWSSVPEGTGSLVLLMHDRDAPFPGGFVHWLVYNIPADATGVPAALFGNPVRDPPELAGAFQGVSDMGRLGYFGPRPQAGDGVHHYVFTVYALSRPPDLPRELNRNQVLGEVRRQVIGQGILTGTFEQN